MISKERFEEKIRWLKEISGQMVQKATAMALWEELKEADINDFEKAIKDLAYSDDKVNLSNLWKHVAKHRGQRIEQEAQDQARNEEFEVKQWFNEHKGTKQECINNLKCYECKRIYCDIIAVEATQAIKDLLNRDKKIDQVNKELSKFQGMGWINPENEPF